jgi:hypothetical protein
MVEAGDAETVTGTGVQYVRFKLTAAGVLKVCQ